MKHLYGPPCFTDNSTRSITIFNNENTYSVFIRTSSIQAMAEGKGDPDEGVLALFEQYKYRLKGEDKKLFKSYFNLKDNG